jgi:hypothetical protein
VTIHVTIEQFVGRKHEILVIESCKVLNNLATIIGRT